MAYVRKYERLANDPEFQQYVGDGRNAYQIARLMGEAYDLVVGTVKFVKTGQRPKVKRGSKRRSPVSRLR